MKPVSRADIDALLAAMVKFACSQHRELQTEIATLRHQVAALQQQSGHAAMPEAASEQPDDSLGEFARSVRAIADSIERGGDHVDRA